jgi:hypothetical protein
VTCLDFVRYVAIKFLDRSAQLHGCSNLPILRSTNDCAKYVEVTVGDDGRLSLSGQLDADERNCSLSIVSTGPNITHIHTVSSSPSRGSCERKSGISCLIFHRYISEYTQQRQKSKINLVRPI